MMNKEEIEEVVEYSLTKKIIPLVKWGIGTALILTGLVSASLLGNAYWRGQTTNQLETQNKIIVDFIETQKKTNEQTRESNRIMIDKYTDEKIKTNNRLNGLLANDYVIKNFLSKAYPEIDLPTEHFRGGVINSKNNTN